MSDEVSHGRNRALEAKADEILAPRAPAPADLADAIAGAIAAQSGWRTATQNAFERFAHAGRLMTAQKESLAHGEWLPWLFLHMPESYQSREDSATAAESWRRTASNWMRIAEILDHCHPAMIEAAQTVSQLFRLAQFLPEGTPGGGGGGGDAELESAEILARIKRYVGTCAPLLDVDRIRSMPRESRAALREELTPMVRAWEACAA